MDIQRFCKPAILSAACFALLFSAGCTQNPVTGQSEFTGLMSPEQEKSIGASQHQEIIKQYGGVYIHPGIQAYVNEIGQKMAQHSERKDVTYRFTVLDSPVVNAFALPGGYIYITRGILSLANSEAELAAVLGHEIGHVAARHQASRYSQGVLTQLGATVLSTAIGLPAASQAIGLGSNLYLSSYSRGQETQSDQLGVRYLVAAGYDPMAMSDFLRAMNIEQTIEAKLDGKQERRASYLSSHPDIGQRVGEARAEALKVSVSSEPMRGETRYLSMIRNMSFGDSSTQGFEKGDVFYHPELGFAFDIPSSFNIDNKPQRIAVEGQDGSVMVLDIKKAEGLNRPEDYISEIWLKGEGRGQIEMMNVNGLQAATTSVQAMINNQSVDVRLIAIPWDNQDFVRMQILIPNGASVDAINDLKRLSYSFRRLSERDRNSIRPYRIELIKAGAGDTIESLSAQMGVSQNKLERFAALNALNPNTPLISGKMYKVVR
jgi:predicted Zn-dependent protease